MKVLISIFSLLTFLNASVYCQTAEIRDKEKLIDSINLAEEKLKYDKKVAKIKLEKLKREHKQQEKDDAKKLKEDKEKKKNNTKPKVEEKKEKENNKNKEDPIVSFLEKKVDILNREILRNETIINNTTIDINRFGTVVIKNRKTRIQFNLNNVDDFKTKDLTKLKSEDIEEIYYIFKIKCKTDSLKCIIENEKSRKDIKHELKFNSKEGLKKFHTLLNEIEAKLNQEQQQK
ncbi:MAG: hypothetical protein HKO66_13035 [Saprospiraceae bacterium]|nr:hypothetical protein [Bacteroidia bacterium]NNE15390.1 hypothetical protein [Saprospiraceae bacterium]NNL93157.1 hypothetical protein [Saprospiraceae bacterium]